MTVWLVGAGGRTPFVGHLRGTRTFGPVRLSWAGRVVGTASVVEGWEAAQAARDVLEALDTRGDLAAVLAAACGALRQLDPRWLGRGDMSVLFVATDLSPTAASASGRGGARAAGSGLAGVYGRQGTAWQPSVSADHPLIGEPGAPDGTSWPIPLADVWVGVPVGLPFPSRDVPAACGVHA